MSNPAPLRNPWDGASRANAAWPFSLRDLDHRRLTTEAATQLLGFERRQVFRLLKAHRTEGATGLFSKQHGKPEEALAIIRGQYCDLGPTLAAEKLREGLGIALGRETLRKWMIADGCGSIASSA